MIVIIPSMSLFICLLVFVLVDYSNPTWSIEKKLLMAFVMFSGSLMLLAFLAESVLRVR